MLTIHKASAGSGKTFQLTLKYITLLLGQPDASGKLRLFSPSAYGFCKPKAHGRILAITFTNKATQEMTDRIIRELSVLANPSKDQKSPYLKQLCEAFSATPEQISDAAHLALADLLYNFSWFNVSTIDAFFQKVLRIFANELDLPEQYNLEINEEYPVTLAVGKMINAINVPASPDSSDGARKQRLIGWLQQYMNSKVEEGRDPNILSPESKLNQGLKKDIGTLRNETFKKFEKQIMAYIEDPTLLTDFVKELRGYVARETNAIASMARDLLSNTNGGELLSKNYRSLVLQWEQGTILMRNLIKGTTLGKVCEDGKAGGTKASVKNWGPGIEEDCRKLALRVARFTPDQAFFNLLIRQSYILGLFGDTSLRLREYCLENEAFLLGDTNSLLRAVINNSDVPFVYERLGQVLNHFLIDEFQDTSEMQWANLRPLVTESLSRGQSDLIIGDVKQCIYRFRNASPELLNSTAEKQASQIAKVEIKGDRVAENTNWRSTREVVIFNNTLFTRLPWLIDEDIQSTVARATYAGVIQQVAEKNRNNAGYVKLYYEIPPAQKSDAKAADAAADAPQPEADSPESDEPVSDSVLAPMAREIERQLAAGYSPKDICVLVYTHKEGAKVIDYLMSLMNEGKWNGGRRINIISSDSMSIAASQAVQMIVAMLRLITTPEYLETDFSAPSGNEGDRDQNRKDSNPAYRRNRLIHRFHTLAAGLPDEEGATGAEGADPDPDPVEAFARALAELDPASQLANEKLDMLQARLKDLAELDCPNLFAVTEEIIRLFLPTKIRRSQAAFISAFQDLVLEFSESGDNDILAFLKWWDIKKGKLSLPAPEGMDALNVMTIHKSKGLEFPCVHIPYTTTKLVDYKNSGWYVLDPKDFPESIRKYVPPFFPLEHKSEYADIPALEDAARAFKLENTIDSLNKIYVACTRAERELCVYLGYTAKEYSKTMATLIYKALNANLSPEDLAVSPDAQPWIRNSFGGFTELPGGSFSILEYGEPTGPAVKETKTVREPESYSYGDDATLPSFNAEIDYEDALDEYVSSKSPVLKIDSRIDETGAFNPEDERHIGNFLHDALAETYRLEDFPEALRKAAYARNIPERFWSRYLGPLSEALADPAVKPWFTDFERVLSERSFTNIAEPTLRRPDRVVWMPDGTIVVIDYKFGKEEPQYKKQVKDYMALLASYGFSNIHGYLFFPLDPPATRLLRIE